MTLLVFSSILFLILFTLIINIYSLYPLVPYSSTDLLNQNNVNVFNYNKIKIEERDSIIIFAYVAITVGIIFPNLNQIDWL